MCGIAGLFSKTRTIEEQLGFHLSAMLSELADRGPDSAGVALYRDRAPEGSCKVSLFSPEPDPAWFELAIELEKAFGPGAGRRSALLTPCSSSRLRRPRSRPGFASTIPSCG